MPTDCNAAVLHCAGVCKTYRDGHRSVDVLSDVELELKPGERLAIIGSSGSGKSTLLNILGGLDAPSSGSVCLLGADVNALSEKKRCSLRNAELGFVYQFHHLLPEFTALENVAMPGMISGLSLSEAQVRAASVLEQVGIADRFEHKPGELSGGERQRVAIARALVMQPACVLMDEPTGNLDSKSADQVLALIDELSSEVAASFVVVTHDDKVAAHLDRILELKQGGLHPC